MEVLSPPCGYAGADAAPHDPWALDATVCAAPVAHVLETSSRACSDFDPCGAGIVIHEGAAGSSLQIATTRSCWMLVAARPNCHIETVDATVTLSLGDVMTLPADMPAMVESRGRGAWIALRLPIAEVPSVDSSAGGGIRLALGQDVMLARVVLELAEWAAQPPARATCPEASAAVRRLHRSLARFQRVQTARAERYCGDMVPAEREQCIAALQRMRLAAMHGDGTAAVLRTLSRSSALSAGQLHSIYSASFRGPARCRRMEPDLSVVEAGQGTRGAPALRAMERVA